jgi:hypothetical protein
MGNLFSLVLDTYIVSNLISGTITKKSLYWRLYALNISLLMEEKAVAIKWKWMTNNTQWDTLLQKVRWSSFCQHSQNSRTEVFHAVVWLHFFKFWCPWQKHGDGSIRMRISDHNKMLHINHVSQRTQHNRNKNYIIWTLVCGLVVRVSGYRYRGLGFDPRRYQIFWVVVGLERGPLSLVRSTEELLE